MKYYHVIIEKKHAFWEGSEAAEKNERYPTGNYLPRESTLPGGVADRWRLWVS